jgi:ketosteroid isomerase-like protein
VNRGDLQDWIAAYERAWRTAGTATLSELFADDASYSMAPYEEPYRGREAIADLWERERQGPDEVFAMDSEVVAVEGNTGVARIEVRYGDPIPREYHDLWIVRLDANGRCAEFEEWPFSPSGGDGAGAHGPDA